MLKRLFDFIINLLYFLAPVFFIQFITYKFFFIEHSLIMILSYSFNFIIAIALYLSTLYFSENNINSSIMVFISLSILKFIIFYLVLYPYFLQDNKIKIEEVFIFFIPYTICSILEIKQLSKYLNSK